MRTRFVAVGAIVLVIGLAMLVGGGAGLRSRTDTYSTFTQPNSGEFVSGEISLNSSSVVDVRSPASDGGLIPASDLAAVTSSNIGDYAISIKSSAGGTDVYSPLKGSYYYVAFASSSPSTQVVTAVKSRITAGYGILALLGFVLIIAGIIVAVIGAIRKGDKKSAAISDSEYYAKR